MSFVLGKRIRDLRNDRRMSIADLAASVGLSRSQMVMIEAGQRRVDDVVLGLIAYALDISPSALS